MKTQRSLMFVAAIAATAHSSADTCRRPADTDAKKATITAGHSDRAGGPPASNVFLKMASAGSTAKNDLGPNAAALIDDVAAAAKFTDTGVTGLRQ